MAHRVSFRNRLGKGGLLGESAFLAKVSSGDNNEQAFKFQQSKGLSELGVSSSIMSNAHPHKIFSEVVETAVQNFTIDLGSLGVAVSNKLRLYLNLANGNGIGTLQIKVNNQLTDTDYNRQLLVQNGTTVNTGFANNSNCIVTIGPAERIQCIFEMSIIVDRFFYTGTINRGISLSPQTFIATGFADGFTIESFTHINLTGTISDIIGPDSEVALYNIP